MLGEIVSHSFIVVAAVVVIAGADSPGALELYTTTMPTVPWQPVRGGAPLSGHLVRSGGALKPG